MKDDDDEHVDGDETSVTDDSVVLVEAPEKTYSVDNSQQFSQYLNKKSSSRYQAIGLEVLAAGKVELERPSSRGSRRAPLAA